MNRGQFVRQLKREGLTILLTTHELATAEAVCDRVGILAGGRLVALGSVAELARIARSPGSHLEDIFLRITIESSGQGAPETAGGPVLERG